ncbi:hypothetical protein F4782DRAFT_170100 [Xylaria castorea]|nr:hypothetical protein F4782DRAFT_170100 [Xylaria castorea]
MTDCDPKPVEVFNRDKSQWPMTYALRQPSGDAPPHRWWRHNYYETSHGQKVDVLYSKTKSHSEKLARQFANERVLGFDMEWPWDADKRPKLQDKVALIQLASERKVALFHIALHEGETVDDLVAPTLKEIIESSTIMKVGVAIINADFRRLRAHFNLEPKGAFELSHLHNLVTYGAVTPHMVTTKLRSLSTQVEQHLGLPLLKGKVRTSDWSQPLNWNQAQYAATDVYACFMLFHCLNAKRLAMDPVPPFPRLAETYMHSTKRKSTTLQLESLTEDGKVLFITAKDFFSPAKDKEQDGETAEGIVSIENDDTDLGLKIIDDIQGEPKDDVKNKKGESSNGNRETTSKHDTLGNDQSPTQKKGRRSRKDAKPAGSGSAQTSMDSPCWSLYGKLASHRKKIAVSKGISAFIIAHNTALQALALHRPSNERELLLVPGIGKGKAAEYGPAWLEIIADFEREQKRDDDDDRQQEASEQAEDGTHMEPEDRDPKRRRTIGVGRSKEMLISSDEPPAVLNTGLSFQFGETSLAQEPSVLPRPQEQDDSSDDDNLAFGPPMELPPPSVLKRKRDIAVPPDPERRPNPLQSATQTAASIPEPMYPVKAEPAVELMSTNDVEAKPPALAVSILAQTLPTLPLVPIPTSTVVRHHLQTPRGRSGLEKTILRNKLEAYVKSVVWAMQLKPNEPLVSEGMLHYLITTVPRTIEEFRCAPGMPRLMKACETVKMDVWRTFEKWTRDDRPGPSAGSR